MCAQAKLGRKADNDALLTSYHVKHLGKVEGYGKPRWGPHPLRDDLVVHTNHQLSAEQRRMTWLCM
jgi:hypothetical protein